MDPLTYLELQIRLEGKRLIGDHLMTQVEILPDEGLPLMLIAALATGEVAAYYNETLPSDLTGELADRVSNLQFPHIDPILRVFNSHNIKSAAGHYQTYLFPMEFTNAPDADVGSYSRDNPKAKAFEFDHFADRVYAIERDGRIVSACASIREDEQCGEPWVYTAPAYRRQGLAQKVLGVWARNLMRAAKTPFYSHKIDNRASAGLADRLGLRPVFEEIGITQVLA